MLLERSQLSTATTTGVLQPLVRATETKEKEVREVEVAVAVVVAVAEVVEVAGATDMEMNQTSHHGLAPSKEYTTIMTSTNYSTRNKGCITMTLLKPPNGPTELSLPHLPTAMMVQKRHQEPETTLDHYKVIVIRKQNTTRNRIPAGAQGFAL